MKPIFAVLVLYRMSLGESPTYASLSRGLRENPRLAEQLQLLVCDNSPEAQAVPVDFGGRYLHDGQNSGLAARYNTALAEAVAAGATWFLLLDQDTTLTPEFCAELVRLAEELARDEEVVAIVPKLTVGAALMSPHAPMFHPVTLPVSAANEGIAPGLIRVYNSGAAIRVSALTAIGGFPSAYWLDYLDHAVFHQLQTAGGRIYVMQAALAHDMAMEDPGAHTGAGNAARHRNQLAAELRFYAEFGSSEERRLHRKELFKQSLKSIGAGHFAKAVRLLRAAFARGRVR